MTVAARFPKAGASATRLTPHRHSFLAIGFSLLLCAALLVFGQMWLLTTRPSSLALNLGEKASGALLTGFHEHEEDARGTYRWSEGDATIDLGQIGVGAAPSLALRLGPPPPGASPPLTLLLNGRRAASFATDAGPRTYRVLLPPAPTSLWGLRVSLQSPTTVVQGDPRPVSLRVERAAIRFAPNARVWPSPLLLFPQVLLLGAVALTMRRVRVPPLANGAAALLIAALLLALAAWRPLLLTPYVLRLLASAALLLALTLAGLPLAERRLAWLAPLALLRGLWGAALLACALRLAGALFPTFAAHDLSLNIGRFVRTALGTTADVNRSFEFARGLTIYPAGPYMALLPGLLLGIAPNVLVPGGIALAEGAGAFAAGLLALRLGSGRRGALLAALLYATVPIGLTALFLGHSAQVFGQALMAPLALVLLQALDAAEYHRRDPENTSAIALPNAPLRPIGGFGVQLFLTPLRSLRLCGKNLWLVAGALLSLALFSHVGVAIIAAAWLGLAWLLLIGRRGWLAFGLVLAASGLVALALVYGDVVLLHFQQLGAVGEKATTEGRAPNYNLIGKAWSLSYQPLGLLLIPVGLLLVAQSVRRRAKSAERAIVASWVVATLLFLAVELATGLQVRYLYFLAPLACIAVGVLLGKLASRGRAGALLATSAALLLAVQGAALWLGATLGGGSMSMIPLLR